MSRNKSTAKTGATPQTPTESEAGVTWSVRGKSGTEYRAVWYHDRLSLYANGSQVGVVPLRENAPEAEAEQVAGFYLSRWYRDESSRRS